MKITKKLLAIVIATLLAVSVIPMTAFAETADATAKPDNAVSNGGNVIYDAADFKAIQTTNTYYIANDIDFGGESFTSIVEKFDGIIDGRGHKLYNFSLGTTESGKKVGVFGTLANSYTATIKNLDIGSPTERIQMTLQPTGTTYAGFLAGQGGSGYHRLIVENVNVYGDIVNTGNGSMRIGGLVGNGQNLAIFNSTMTGSIKTEATDDTEKNIGGIVGLTQNGTNFFGQVIDNCVNNADLLISGVATGRLGGIIGMTGSDISITDCVNNGSLASTSHAGGIVGLQWKTSLYLKNCVNTYTDIVATNSGVIVGGINDITGNKSYRYIKNCTPNTQNTTATAIKDLEGLQAMETGGVYYLANDIDLGGATFNNYVVSTFAGVLDGNGRSIYNFTIEDDGTSDVGFFCKLSPSNAAYNTLITDLTLGTETDYAKIIVDNVNGKSVGVLAGAAGSVEGNTSVEGYEILIDNVNIYADLSYSGPKANVAGYMGYAKTVGFTDCDLYGSVTTSGNVNSGAYVNTAGFIANVASYKIYFYNCNNIANINNDCATPATNPGKEARAGGFYGYNAYHAVLVSCNNFGNITASATENFTSVQAGGFYAQHGNGNKPVTMIDCANFGAISSGKDAAAISPYHNVNGYALNFTNYGTVSGAQTSDTIIDASPDDNYVFQMLNSSNASIVSMEDGASVRIDPDPADAGIRFKSVISEDAYNALADAFGAENITYGTVIAPTAFIERATDFTVDALDAWATTVGLGNGDAYIDVPANGWYTGEDRTFAGSLNALDSGTSDNASDDMFDTKFSARSYVKATMGETVYIFWSTYDSEKNSRSFIEVTNKAIEDIKYKKAGEDDKWYSDAACETEYTKADKSTYVTPLGEADSNGVTSYTCYTLEQYNALVSVLDAVTSNTEQQ